MEFDFVSKKITLKVNGVEHIVRYPTLNELEEIAKIEETDWLKSCKQTLAMLGLDQEITGMLHADQVSQLFEELTSFNEKKN